MTKIELEQHLENNEAKGAVVMKVVKDSVFDQIGIQEGDIIIRVDEMQIDIADDAMEIYNCLRTMDNIEFEVLRNGETKLLNYRQQN